jgi:hypothetical protein
MILQTGTSSLSFHHKSIWREKEQVHSGVPILEPKQWIVGLYNTGIMNLLEIPHFGRGKDVNNCVKQLLALVHGGILWMDRPVSIDVYLIAKIIGFPTDGENPEQYLDDKTKEKSLAEEMKKNIALTEDPGG